VTVTPRRGERAYGLLLRFYPRAFREEYGLDLLEEFRRLRDKRIRAQGRLGPGYWAFIVRDTASTAWKEHRRPMAGDRVKVNSGGDGMRGWMDDLGYATRRLMRSPGFSATALAILVLGIGVNTTAFSIVNALLLQPPPFRNPEAIVDILQDGDDGQPNSTSYPAFEDITRTEGVFQSVAAVVNSEGFLGDAGELTSVLVEYATSGYMDVLGLSPVRGRWFDSTEDLADGPVSAVITHKMWTERLRSDPDILGSTLRIGGSAVTVIGVGPREYNGGAGPAVSHMWLSIGALGPTGSRSAFSLGRREDHHFSVRARLLPSVTVEQARSSLTRLADQLAATYPTLNEGRRISVIPVGETRISPEVDGRLAPVAALLMAVVVLVLVLATLNLANLLLVRTTARAREIAVRIAMGAGRGRVIRVVMSEALVLAAVGGAGGLGAAVWTVRFLERARFELQFPLALDVRLDSTVLLFAIGVSLISGIVFGLVPALRVTSRDLSVSLRDESDVALGARRRFGLAGVLVAGQVSVSLLLLTVASVFVESLLRSRGADPGFDWENAAFAQVSLSPLGVGGAEAETLYKTLEERIEAIPEVVSATFAVQIPGAQFGSTTLLLGSGLGGVNKPTETPWNVVALDYFEVLGIPILEGRGFLPEDAGAPTAIVSEAMARAHWGRTDIVGEVFSSEADPDEPQEIIGVVADVTLRSLGEAPGPGLYWLYEGGAQSRGNLVFQASADPGSSLGPVREVIRQADPRILLLTSRTMSEHLGSTLANQRIAGTVLTGMGALALLLALLGVYGVVSFSVSQRRREVGIRQALGADGASVVRLFVRDVAGVVVVGALVGLVLAIPIGRFVGEQFAGGGGSPWMTGVVALALMATALVATVVPAVRAARSHPKDTLMRD